MGTRKLTVAPSPLVPCGACSFRQMCGGLESQQEMFGCFAGCGSCGVERGECDFTCPRKPSRFWRDWLEVGGLNPRLLRDIPSPADVLPLYVPMVRHGSSRSLPLPNEVVALNTFEVVDSQCQPKFESAAELREAFKLNPTASVVLISVKQDTQLEAFWRHRDVERLRRLRDLEIVGVTAPNYSFFDDAPRIHLLRNLWRIVRTAENLAEAGLPAVLHVNAHGPEDWRTWAQVIRSAPGVRYVAKEFQTGLSNPERAASAVAGLARLQEEVGRPLHPIVVGGRRVAFELSKHFSRITVVDSRPFMAALNRKRFIISGNGNVSQVDNALAEGAPVDDLLQDNIRTYSRLVRMSVSTAHLSVPDDIDATEPDD